MWRRYAWFWRGFKILVIFKQLVNVTLRITFDTNVLDRACRPQRFLKDTQQPMMRKVYEALANGQIKGFYPVTMLTIEGIEHKDRAKVFAGTRIETQPEVIKTIKGTNLPDEIRNIVGDGDLLSINVEYNVEQPDRKPLHREMKKRATAAKALGIRALKAVPREGSFHIIDPTDDWYLKPGEGVELDDWTNRVLEVARAIEDRGLGFAQLKALGESMLTSERTSPWYRNLDKADDKHKQNEVIRAFSEWADGDSLASHIAYGLDIFCSHDFGKSNAKKSILDPTNRLWLNETYDVQFMTFEELAANLA